jgi:hypothetical protein
MRTPKRKWIITGTDTSAGSRDMDHSFEWARTKREAWQQALTHASGTSFYPEKITEG